MASLSSRRIGKFLIAASLFVIFLLIIVAAFPLRWLKGSVENSLSSHVGAPFNVGSLDREAILALNPIVRVTDVHMAQPRWAGQGTLASVRLLRFRLSLLPLLVGRIDAHMLDASGVRLDLIRTRDGRVNWSGKQDGQKGGSGIDLSAVRIEDAHIRYRDAKQARSATLAMTVDPATGLVASGSGVVDGAPVKLGARGGPLTPDRRWPFVADIQGQRLSMHFKGSMAAPLHFDDMAFHVTAKADDLKRIDRVIEAGLFGTRDVDLVGDVRRKNNTWFVDRLSGTIGRSRFAGHVSARKADERVRLDGTVRFAQLDFEDLASDSGNAKAVVLEETQGLRLVPNTRIDIHKMHETDGRIALRVDRVLPGRRPSSLTQVEGVLALDHLLLTIDPLRIGLTKGAITGRAVVDQRDGAPSPLVTLTLDMTDSSISALAGGSGGDIDARVDARVRLTGRGDTIREAVGRSDGTIGIVARSGALPEKIAAMLGFDIGKALFGSSEDKVALRCGVVRLDMRSGTGTLAPLLVDTSISQTRGSGTVRFPDEAIAVKLTGAPKSDAALRVPGSVSATGTLREPTIVVPKEVKSVGTVLKAIGRKISGDDGPSVRDADCTGLSRKALG